MIKYHVENLTCANCALKIEKEVNEIKGVNSASLNLMGQQLHVDSNLNEEKLKLQIQSIADKIEPGVLIKLAHQPIEKQNNLMLFAELGLGIALFILGLANIFNLSKVFFFLCFLVSGFRVIRQALINAKNLRFFDEYFLMSIATIGALIIGETMEAAAVMLFYMIGETLQKLAVNKSKKNILELMDTSISLVTLENGQLIDPRLLKVGDVITIHPGEKIQVDSTVVAGESYIDTKMLTGESIPRKIRVNDEVKASMLNTDGVLKVRVDYPYDQSTMAKMIEMLENAPTKKAQTERFITRFSKVYTPVVVVMALIIGLVFPLIFKDVSLSQWIHRALIFLVASCPCALVVSVPLSYFAGLGRASKENILVKAAHNFEDALKIKKIYFDKTGTITKGNFSVVDYSNEQTLYLAALLEQYSKHPISKAILDANKQPLEDTITRFREISGQGLAGKLNGDVVLVGNSKLMESEDVMVPISHQIGTHVYVAVEKTYIGSIVIADEVKEGSVEAVRELETQFDLALLSGDHNSVVSQLSSNLNIKEAHGELYPEDKLNLVKDSNVPSMFVGDGINDALVLSQADLGVAMGQLGSDMAIEAADIVLAKDDLRQLNTFFMISQKTNSIVLFNVIMALVIKALVLLLGVLGMTNMLVAVFADVGVTLLAVFNSLRILR